MSFFNRKREKSLSAMSDPIALRNQLFDAAKRRDNPALINLCTTNRAMILQHFPTWSNVNNYPDVNRKDAQQIQFIIDGLGSIAATFRDNLTDSSLWDRLVGPPAQNPFIRFEQTLNSAKALAGEMRHQEAVDLITAYLIDIKNLQGNAADNFRAYGHGMIGMSLVQSNRATDALQHLRQALTICTSLNDKEGVQVYLSQLYDAHRYLGQAEQAAVYAERLAEHFNGTPQSQIWLARAARQRAGEPLLRMVARQNDRTLELDELTELEGNTTFLFERNRPTLAPSTALVSTADKLAAIGKYDDALAIYHDAAKADPFNPHPHYHAGITLLLLHRYPEAVEEYEAVATLAPGWFNVGSDLWIAQELLAGRLTHDTFLVIWAAENSGSNPSEKLESLEQAINYYPEIPNLHFLRGLQLIALSRKEEAITAFDLGLAAKPEPDIQSRLLAQRAVLCDLSTQRRLFQQILQIADSNLMSRTMAEAMLKRAAV